MLLPIASCLLVFMLTPSPTFGLEPINNCTDLLGEFAASTSLFMGCASCNARPITMCTQCKEDYMLVKRDHMRILNVSDLNNKKCRDQLINLDRLEIIESGYSYVTELWNKGNCENCYESSHLIQSNYTRAFYNLYDAAAFCIGNFSATEEVCNNCSSQYILLNMFYDELKGIFGDGKLCMDIVDAMNVTQNKWSEVLHCGENVITPEIPLIASFVTMLALPVIFYLSAWHLSSHSPSLVSNQKRLSTRLMERLRSRTGSMINQLRH